MTFRRAKHDIQPDCEAEQNGSKEQPVCACHATSVVAVWVSARAKGVPWRLGLSDVTMKAIHEAVPLLRFLAWHGICPCSVAFRYNLETTAVARLPHLESGGSQ